MWSLITWPTVLLPACTTAQIFELRISGVELRWKFCRSLDFRHFLTQEKLLKPRNRSNGQNVRATSSQTPNR
ncbi:uncharacterized protein IWZ02DRAFT_444172 [Phyllosticta citriasiana]|uniref:uncharacterized protein n=1 Tax=Phyllosticta citriasiana TaxID=595635 RepID=UPI0030FD962C